MPLKNPHLHRYWFDLPVLGGVGVTAYSLADAEFLARGACSSLGVLFNADGVVEDIDVRDLDQNHVIPNMGPVNLRGVWYPQHNL